ncbi:hypothetical protein G5I_06704 [Acromyrmex echinatior]|uniref:Uncharacterized protein n=1 Tax=Acromyrmex echinatior TaxID=103372 RepID=F4WLS3_ACREC|nr:hypothetical protein G5I_06704 [Acromyrmex echinatior]
MIAPLTDRRGQLMSKLIAEIQNMFLRLKNPIFSYVNATLNGLPTIRSSSIEIEKLMRKRFDELQDHHCGTQANTGNDYWLSYWTTLEDERRIENTSDVKQFANMYNDNFLGSIFTLNSDGLLSTMDAI